MSQAKSARQTETLQDITLQTLATTTRAADRAVVAYRAGGHRLVAAFDQRVTSPVVARAERVAPRLAAALRRSGRQAGVLAVMGIDAVSQGTGKVLDLGSRQVAAQVKRVAGMAYAVRQPVLAKGLDAAARLSLPGARAALSLSQQVAALADKLPEARSAAKSAGKSGVKSAGKAAAQPAAKPARRAASKAKVVAEAPAQAKAAVRRGTARAQAAVAEAAQPVRQAATRARRSTAKAVKAVSEAAAAA